jgi:MFS transporter, DHA2 family, multidrug resistance protein
VTIAAITLIDFDKPDYSLFERFDFVGLIFVALFLGALEYVLEDGPRFAAIFSATSTVIFFARALTAYQPIVDLRAFVDRSNIIRPTSGAARNMVAPTCQLLAFRSGR